MKQSTKEFRHLVAPLGLESPFFHLQRNKRIYKIWRKSQIRSQWRNLKNWLSIHLFRKRTYINATGYRVCLRFCKDCMKGGKRQCL